MDSLGKSFQGYEGTSILRLLNEMVGHKCDTVMLNNIVPVKEQKEMIFRNVVFPAESKMFIVSHCKTTLEFNNCDALGKFEFEIKQQQSDLTSFHVVLNGCYDVQDWYQILCW